MRRVIITNRPTIKVNESYVAKPLEQEIREMMQQGEGIDKTAPLIYTERKDGVRPEFDIRTDRFEVAREAMDKVHQSDITRRAERIKERAEKGLKKDDGNEGKKDGGTESIQTTDN